MLSASRRIALRTISRLATRPRAPRIACSCSPLAAHKNYYLELLGGFLTILEPQIGVSAGLCWAKSPIALLQHILWPGYTFGGLPALTIHRCTARGPLGRILVGLGSGRTAGLRVYGRSPGGRGTQGMLTGKESNMRIQ